MNIQRLVLFSTVTLMMLFVLGKIYINFFDPSYYLLNTTNQPTIGNLKSKTEVVVFLDPKSTDSKNYNNDLFQKIKKKYIDTNKIKYTTIIVSKEPPMLIAEALLCTYYQDENTPSPELFYSLLNNFYSDQSGDTPLSIDSVLAIGAKANPEINIEKIKKCIQNRVYDIQIMSNNQEASRVTNGKVDTPAFFINGNKTALSNQDAVFRAIDQALLK